MGHEPVASGSIPTASLHAASATIFLFNVSDAAYAPGSDADRAAIVRTRKRPMITHLCDRCGRPIEQGELRYTARIEVFAAADPLEVTAEDLTSDTRHAIEQLIERCAGMTEEELMRDVHVAFQFDLCRRCQLAYVLNPLGGR